MRIIGSFDQQFLARKFSLFLSENHIDNTLDAQLGDHGKFTYSIWVHDEDNIEKAATYFEKFKKNPDSSEFNVSLKNMLESKAYESAPPPQEEAQENNNDVSTLARLKRIKPTNQRESITRGFPITWIVFFICAIVYISNFYQEHAYQKQNGVRTFVTPVQYYMMFDAPVLLIKLTQFVKENHIDLSKQKEISLEYQQQIEQIMKSHYWRGIYEVLLNKWNKTTKDYDFSASMFVKIREGQIWRLLTPAFLHISFFHILFNMLWLFFLGKQLEARLSAFRYLVFIVIVAIFTNVLQYLMSGPYFLGYSGVVMGMAGFTWMRQREAPWEGYPLPRATVIFLAFYVIAMLAIQLFSFFTELSGKQLITFPIANTAHISGAILGIILGKWSFFAWRPNEH